MDTIQKIKNSNYINYAQEKENLRIYILEERKKLKLDKLNNLFVQKIKFSKEYQNAKNILIFYPLKYEINLLELLKDKTKKFYLPKISDNTLVVCPYSIGDILEKSIFNTNEPLSNPVDKNIIDLAIIPALAVDEQNYRLGYGGGFYDRFLSDFNNTTLVCIPKMFILNNVYPEKHDIRIDKIIKL
jgi:5-formyltetrahydrofolate cyclo-ligase